MIHVMVSGPWARVTCTENLRSVSGGQENMGVVQATNLYTFSGEEWLMIHHHGSPIFTELNLNYSSIRARRLTFSAAASKS